jgi:hypothetical protein
MEPLQSSWWVSADFSSSDIYLLLYSIYRNLALYQFQLMEAGGMWEKSEMTCPVPLIYFL